jgi:glutaredoxin
MMKKRHKIILYVSSNSHPSELAREYFRQTGFDFDEIDIDKNKDTASEIFDRVDKKEAPIAEIDGRVVAGYRPDIFAILLNDRGGENPQKKEE